MAKEAVESITDPPIAMVICRLPASTRSGSAASGAASGPALIASMHQSAFDTLVWMTLVPRCCYVLKQELLRVPLFGRLIPYSGMIAIDRFGGAQSLRALMQEGARAAREARQMVIFPEGTRAAPGESRRAPAPAHVCGAFLSRAHVGMPARVSLQPFSRPCLQAHSWQTLPEATPAGTGVCGASRPPA